MFWFHFLVIYNFVPKVKTYVLEHVYISQPIFVFGYNLFAGWIVKSWTVSGECLALEVAEEDEQLKTIYYLLIIIIRK